MEGTVLCDMAPDIDVRKTGVVSSTSCRRWEPGKYKTGVEDRVEKTTGFATNKGKFAQHLGKMDSVQVGRKVGDKSAKKEKESRLLVDDLQV